MWRKHNAALHDRLADSKSKTYNKIHKTQSMENKSNIDVAGRIAKLMKNSTLMNDE